MLTPQTTDLRSPVPADAVTFSRRALGKHLLLGASALAVLVASGKREPLQAAPLTDPWKLGGNLAVTTDGSNFIGTLNVAPLVFKTAATNNTPTERMRITPAGNVGIGTSAPIAKLQVESTTAAIVGRHSVPTGAHPGVQGDTLATVEGATGVYGLQRSTAPGVDSSGVRGTNSGINGNGAGVRGIHAGSGVGVQGTSVSGYGVHGKGTYGIFGQGANCGLHGLGTTYGVMAYAVGTDATGAYFSGTERGVLANSSSLTGYAGYFLNLAGDSTQTTGVGVQGLGSGGSDARIHPSDLFYDAGGEFSGPNGVIGAAAASGGSGLIGIQGPGSFAIFSMGNMHVIGTLGVSGTKNFEIDHPLDPANKILRHAAVESSEVKNTYDGTVTLKGDGTATVTLPDWMEALNKDFHYQLTTIGGYAPVYIAEEIKDNRFKIAGGKPGMKVCWQVIGIRNDTYMQQHPLEVESEKQGADRGKYLVPQAYGKSADKGVGQLGYRRAPRSTPTSPPQERTSQAP